MEAINASQLAQIVLRDMNNTLAESFDADVMFIKSPMQSPLDGQFRIEVETIQANDNSSDNLCVILGAYILN